MKHLRTALLAAAISAGPAWAGSHEKILIDATRNLSTPGWNISSADWGAKGGPKWSVQLRTLHGGRQEGTQVIDVVNGAMAFTIVPTRGFEVWKATVGDLRLGWDSPVTEVVHPALVSLTDHGNQGWLDGFGGWVVRGGLASFGAPVMDGETQLTLHGHVDYIPASFASVRYEDGPVPKLVFRGIVNDTQMFGPNLRLTSNISVEIGKTAIRFDDAITNLADTPQEFENLYHINFGTPLLGAGAEFVAPVQQVAPMNAASAQKGLQDWNRYTGPHAPGYAAQVFLLKLQGNAAGETQAMLKSADGTRGALLQFNTRELPYMSLWKNEAAAKTGYVTGLEPGTGYPYARPVERAAGRVPSLAPGASYHLGLTIRALTTSAEVAKAGDAIAQLRSQEPVVLVKPLDAP
ncbi:MAG: hypothetical protein JWN16_623 [Alphaproteobacteria bacterium]|nr:hypothetical protein [Alphaproteobacteria bacterium]